MMFTAKKEQTDGLFHYKTKGTCSTQIELRIEEGVITDCRFINGCNGNTKGISALVVGQRADEVKERLRGITCGRKATSCPDQLARAIEAYEQEQG